MSSINKSVDSAYLALFLTDAAAYALSMVNNCTAVSHGNCRTAQLHAHTAAYTLVSVYLERWIMLNVLEKCTWTAGNNY